MVRVVLVDADYVTIVDVCLYYCCYVNCLWIICGGGFVITFVVCVDPALMVVLWGCGGVPLYCCSAMPCHTLDDD